MTRTSFSSTWTGLVGLFTWHCTDSITRLALDICFTVTTGGRGCHGHARVLIVGRVWWTVTCERSAADLGCFLKTQENRTLIFSIGCYKMTGVNMYYLCPVSCWGGWWHRLRGGEGFSMPMPRGGGNLVIPQPPWYRLIMTAPHLQHISLKY